MRKPSKLLSLFLAFVMVLTSLSVGLTAFAAQEQWKGGSTYTNSVNGIDVTEAVQNIAVLLYGNGPTSAIGDASAFTNGTITDLNSRSDEYRHHGTYIKDLSDGSGYQLVQNVWDILFTKGQEDGQNTINVDQNGYDLIDSLKDYMGDDFQANWDSYGDGYWLFLTMIGVYKGDWNYAANRRTSGSGCNTKYYYAQNAYAVVIELDPDYYLWNYYGDVLADLPEGGIIPKVKTFYFADPNDNTTEGTSSEPANNLKYRSSKTYYLDQTSDAIYVAGDELKSFGEVFTDIWEAFGTGDFENVPSDTFVDILTYGMDRMEAIRDANGSAEFNGLRAVTDTANKNAVGTTAVTKTLNVDTEATEKIFEHFFPINADGIEGADIYEKFKALYDSFIEWMIQRFKDAVNTIGESYTAGVINDGLTFEDFTDLKYNFTVAYDIWDAFPEQLKTEGDAPELKNKLDAYYYNESDTKENITSFVPAWNNASAQAYIDATEELEFASGEGYIIKNDTEFERVKELLDAAEALYGDIYWESSYENKPDGTPNYSDLGLLSQSLLFESETGNNVQGGAEVVEHAKKVWDGAYVSYREYLYRKFISIASANLDEYIKDTNGNGKIDEDDEIPEITVSLATMVVFRTKMQKVESAYNTLPDDIKERALVKFYMSIVAKIQEAINSLDDWSRYNDLENPYYYNWDEKKKEISAKDDVTTLLNGLNELIGSPLVLDLLSDMLDADVDTSKGMGTFVRELVEKLICDNANSIFQLIFMNLMPLVQGALQTTYVDAVNDYAYNFQRNGGKASALGISISVYAEILLSDPDMLNNTFPAASKVSDILGYKGISQYTSDPDIIAAANEIAKAKDNWDNVNWDNVDFKIDNISEFSDVMGTILRMIDKLVNMILFDEPAVATTDCTISSYKTSSIDKHHTKGYEKDVIPMLEALGITGLPTYSEAKTLSNNSKWDEFIEKVLNAILDSVENMFNEGAATGILNLLPNLAYMLYWDKLTGPVIKGKGEYNGWIDNGMPSDVYGIGDLLAPLTELAGLSLYGLAKIEHLDGAFVNEKITGITLGDTGIVLPEINWAAILGLGEMDRNATPTSRTDGQRKNINAIPEEVVLYFISYIAELITTNSDVFHDLIAGKLPEGNEKVAELFEQLYGNLIKTASDPKAFAAVLLELVRTVEVENYDWADYDTWNWEQSLVDYTGLPYTKKDVTDSIDTLSAIAINALNKFVFDAEDSATLSQFISTLDILNGDLINTVFKAIYGLDSATVEMILKFVEVKDGAETNGIDISLDNVIDLLADYPDVAAVLEAWAADHPYIVDEVPSGEYEVTCNNKVLKEVEDKDDPEEVECGNKTVVDSDSGTISCEECGQSITYTAEDVKVLTKTVSLFDDEEAITADMWNVTDLESFKNALVTILDPFKYIVGAALAGDGTTISVAGIINVVLDDGYKNVIKPLLSVFENEADFTLDDSVKADTALDQILTMLINLVDAIAADPVNIIISVLPQLAAFVDNSGIQNLIGYFIQPFWNVISAVLDLVQLNNDFVPKTDSNRIYDNSLFGVITDILLDGKADLSWENLEDGICDLINIFLENIITIGNEKYSITLPAIDWADLAGSGTKGANSIVADKESVVVKLLRYVWKVVLANSTTIEALLTENVGEFWGKLSKHLAIADYSEDDFVYLVLTIINGLDSSEYDSTEVWDGILNAVYEPTTDVVYPVDQNGNTYTPEDVDKLVKFISGIAVGVVEEFVDGFDISQIGPTIYSSAVPGLIGKHVLPLLEEQKDIFKLIGISYGYADLIAALTEAGYTDVVTAIEAQSVETLADIDWSTIADDNLFAISNADQFTKALVTLLEPFMPLVGFLLNSGTIMVLDVVPLTGSNGYANALLPLLKILEIDAIDAETYAANAEADPKNLLADIIGPLFAWVDNALWISEDADGPAGTLLSVLPNLAKLFDQGGLQQFIGDITYPFSNLINTLMSILTQGKQDDIFALGFDIVLEMLSGEAEEDSNLIDKILDMIFGAKTEKEITWYNFHEHIFDLAAKYIKIDGATISVDKDGNLVLDISVSGNPMTIVVPKYNLARLAGIDNTDETKKATDTLLVIWQYIWDGILNNETTFASVTGLLSNELGDAYTTKILDATLGKYIEKLLGSEANEIVAALIQTMEATDASDYDSSADWEELLSKVFDTTVAEYGDYTADDINFVIETVSEILTSVLEEFANLELSELANGYLYKDSTVSAIAKIIVGLGSNSIANILGIIGIDLSKDGIADKLEALGYADVAAIIRAAESVDDIDWDSIIWNADSAEGFANALAAVISPFEDILGYLLTAGDISIIGANVLSITGANGYDNAVKHLLEEAFGCTGLKDSSEYASVTELMAAIFNAIFGQIDSILASDNIVGTVLDAIPQLSAFIARGGVQQFVKDLLYPITNLITPIFSLVYDGSIYDFALALLKSFDIVDDEIEWDNVQDNLIDIINSFLNFTVKGEDITITLNKNLTWAKLAGCATRPDTLLTIFSYIWENVQGNKSAIETALKALLGEDTYANVKDYVKNFLKNDDTDIVKAIVQVFRGFDASGHIADWRFLTDSYKSKSPKYPAGITATDVSEMIDSISTILDNALSEFVFKGDYASLADFVSGKLYTGDLVKTVQDLINSLAENETVGTILGLLGVKLEVNNKSYSVTDKNSFIDALAEILAPFEPLIKAYLTEGDITIAGVVTLTSSDVFNNAIKPLLEYAVGCTNVKDASIKGILTAVLGRVDEILENPADELLGIIPMLANFINEGGVQYFVEELLYPILNIASPILALVTDTNSVFDFAFDLLGVESKLGVKNVTWKNIHTKIPAIINGFLKDITINGGKYTFTVNSLDLAALAACGKANGLNVIGNNPDTFVTLFDIIWNIVQENKKAINSLIDSLLSDDVKSAVGKYVNNFFSNDSTDLVKAMVEVFKGFNASGHVADWSFLFTNFKQTNVKYPKGVTSSDIEEVIEILTTAIENALEIFLDTTLPALAGDIIYTDSIINSVKNIVNSLAGNDTVKAVFGMLGLDINVNDKTYTVTDKASFAAALADVLAPFEPIIDAFLNKGDITIADVVTLTGADGFNNAVKPLLEYALGCTNVNDRTLKGIITAVLDRVEEILADPVAELIDIVPMISNFIGKGGVQYFVEELLYPVINIADAIVTLFTDDSLFDFAFGLLGIDLKWSDLQNEIVPFANAKLKNVTINGKSYSITIPSIDWLKLGGCGKLSGTTIRANQGDVVMTIFEYLFKAIEANKAVLYDLVGGKDSTVGEIITNILNEGAGGFVKIIVTVLLKMETFDNVTWLFKNIKPVETTYTPNYGEEDYTRFVQDIDEAIFGLLGSFTDLNVGTLLSDQVYKNSIVNTVAKLVYTNLENITVAGISIHKILQAIDLDITTATVADMLKDFSAASAEIGKHGAWSEVNFDAINWNFEDGDKAGFVSALSAALRPIQPLIRVILSGEDLVVLGSIHVKGGNGYNTVVIPLLEALGVEPADLVSAADYSAAADTDKLLTSVITPVLDFAETLLDKPIYTLANMLPNVAYFLLNGGAQAIVENIAGPVFNLLEEVAPIYDLNVDKLLKDNIGFGISDLGSLDLDGLVNTLLASIEIKGQKLTIRITDIDLETLAGRGELVEYTSARTYNGVPMVCKKVVADTPAVFISVLRYIVANLKANLDAIKELLAGLGLSGDVADMINMILGFLTDLDTDMVIEQLMELLFGGGTDDAPIDSTAPYEVRDMSALHWTIVGCSTLFMLLIFLALLTKKKKEEEPAEAAAQK